MGLLLIRTRASLLLHRERAGDLTDSHAVAVIAFSVRARHRVAADRQIPCDVYGTVGRCQPVVIVLETEDTQAHTPLNRSVPSHRAEIRAVVLRKATGPRDVEADLVESPGPSTAELGPRSSYVAADKVRERRSRWCRRGVTTAARRRPQDDE